MIPSDIRFYHSGGALNDNPELDLGGTESVFELTSTLFDTLTPEQSLLGRTDYRCFYIYNSSTDVIRNAKLFLYSEKPSGSQVDLGIDISNEIQLIEFSGTPNEGDTTEFSINSTSFSVGYSPNPTIWQGSFQTEIRGIDGLKDVIVEVSGVDPAVSLTVNFVGCSQHKNFPLISVVTNGYTNTTINISQVEAGSPINTTAPTIATKYHTPTDVNFAYYGPGNPILLGDFFGDDIFPVWVRRYTPKNTRKKTHDNFILKITGGTT